jgi:GT2 family glycosyltransferase
MKKISVVIPVYGQWNLLKKNIDSILDFEESNIEEIIVIDDCSPESNPYHFSNDKISIYQNNKNLGYAGTVNNGLKRAKSDIILLLDSDAHLIGPVLEKIVNLFDGDNTIGCIGLTSIGKDGLITGSFQTEPTIIGYIIGQAAEARFAKIFQKEDAVVLPFSCCVAFKKGCLEEVSYFDDKVFPQVEADVDLGLRIYKSGWKILIEKQLKIYHQGGNSYKVNSKRVRLYHEAKWKLLVQHYDVKYPKLMKFALRIRVQLEIFYMQIFMFTGNHHQYLSEKLLGRKELLKDIRHY